jgi:RimJ/RimL family protein N-acetyltransferase
MTIYTIYNDKELLVRRAEKADASEILLLLNKAGGESENLSYGENQLDISLAQEEEYIEKHNQSSNSLLIVAVYNDKIVGILNFSGGSRERIAHCGMFGMSVLKDYWGIGIGTSLLDFMLDWAEETEVIKKIELQVKIDNKRAIELYKKMGFSIEGRLKKSIKIKDEFFDTLYMGKLIN